MDRLTISIALAAGMLFLMPGSQSHTRTAAPADTIEVPRIITLGFDAYKFGGPVAAIKAWVKDGPIDGNKDALSKADALRQSQASFGSFRSFEVIASRTISPSTRIIYMALDYERGPLFAKFSLFRTEESWVITALSFDTHEDQILPCQ